MPENPTDSTEIDDSGAENNKAPRRRPIITKRRILGASVFITFSIFFLAVTAYVLYRAGTFDRYIKDQLASKLSEVGIEFESESFRVTASPMTVELRNAMFRDHLTGQKLFFIREARLGLTILDLLSWRLSRDISIDTSDISGAELWITFDENGRSNFSNLKLVESAEKPAVNFRYDSVNFSVRDSLIHFGDISRRIAAEGRNVGFLLSPDLTASDVPARFRFDLWSDDANFSYGEKALEKITVRAKGVADSQGADIESLNVHSPAGDSSISGNIREWSSPKYDLDIDSSIDVAQIANTFELQTTLAGVSNFKGKISGSGENYRIEGNADSAALRAGGIYLKALDVAATVEGTNANYYANGKAVAEMLTFEDFKIDFPKMTGNVRGTGTDFRWFGELQAIAARSPSLTLGGLFLSDALAEYKDRQLKAESGNARIQKLAAGDIELNDINARKLMVSTSDGGLDIASPGATGGSLISKDYRLDGLSGSNIRVSRKNGETSVKVTEGSSKSGSIGGNRITGVRSSEFQLNASRGKADMSLSGVRADRVDADGTRIDGIETPLVTLADSGGTATIYAEKARVAKLDTGSVVLGSLNIGGVRLTIRSGYIEGSSNDVDAGDITLARTKTLPDGGVLGNARFSKPVFIVEPSGKYRASADMSIGGGTVGTISLGAASAKVAITNERTTFDQIDASVMGGRVSGAVVVASNRSSESKLDAQFTGLDLSKLLAIQSGRVIALAGKTDGDAHLTFKGSDIRSSSGNLKFAIAANAGAEGGEIIPVNGNIDLAADNGLFSIADARLTTAKSRLDASGRFDLRNDASDLKFAVGSSDAGEVRRLVRITGALPDVDQQIESLNLEFAGDLRFDGAATGNIYDPNIDGKLQIHDVLMRQRLLGSVSTDIAVGKDGVDLRNGKLSERAGGTADFAISIPYGTPNSTAVTANLRGVDAANLLAALPIDLPERLADLNGKTSGTVDIRGLPNNAQGNIDLTGSDGTIAGEKFDTLNANAIFQGTEIVLRSGDIRFGNGSLNAKGAYDRGSGGFDAELNGRQVPAPLALSFLPKNDSIPAIGGLLDLNLRAVGVIDRPLTYDVRFDGKANQVTVGDDPFGDVAITGKTENNVLNAELTADLSGHSQIVKAAFRFDDDRIPFKVSTSFNQSPVTPYIAFVPKLKAMPISGNGTGVIEFGGNLRTRNGAGEYVYGGSDLAGTAVFDQLSLLIQETPLSSVGPVSLRFNVREVVFDNARFSGGGSNMTISGTKAIADDAVNDLDINGKVSLNLLNLAKTDVFFAGLADVAVHVGGPNKDSRLSGSALTENATISTFVGSDRLTLDRVRTKVVFTANEAEIEQARGYLGGGIFNAGGGATLDGLSVRAFRLTLNGDNVTVPLPKDFSTTGDAQLEFTGRREGAGDNLQMTVAGRVFARRSLYSKDIDLASLVGGRRDPVLSNNGGDLNAIRYDLTIEGRDALIVKNNTADLTASVSLALTGDSGAPHLAGRITANSGTIFFRKERYEVQRGVLEFPPDTTIDPEINLQAETEIAGYQVFVNLTGPLKDSELLSATVRSSPALPQADVVSLITTGALSNAAGGIPTFAQTGINTAAEILTDSIVNNPVRRATDRLFGLNVFEIDPIISGQQLNPSARLTVGRQINNNLRVTYSTNLSQDQNQILALEYRVSNKLSFVAQYEQRSLSNVTRNRDNFSFEIRFRRRF
jgi:translocation and assembly module TamB